MKKIMAEIKKIAHKNKKLFALLFAFLAMLMFVGCENSTPKEDSDDIEEIEMDHSTYCLLYMDVSNVKLSHKYDYTYCTGTIENNGDYSIKFVKVKGVFKDRYGKIVDTDWTYAVDSSWLDPGEKKTFEMMIEDEDARIVDCDVSVMYYD